MSARAICVRAATLAFSRAFRAPEQIELSVARLHEAVGRQTDSARRQRLRQTRGHKNHELGFSLAKLLTAKQRAENRHRAQARELRDGFSEVVVDEAGQAHALSVTQLDGATRRARFQAG